MERNKFIPLDQEDALAMHHISTAPWSELAPHAPLLLEYLKDMRQPFSRVVEERLSAHINATRHMLIDILRGDDVRWKTNVLFMLFKTKERLLHPELLAEVERISRLSSEEPRRKHDAGYRRGCNRSYCTQAVSQAPPVLPRYQGCGPRGGTLFQ